MIQQKQTLQYIQCQSNLRDFQQFENLIQSNKDTILSTDIIVGSQINYSDDVTVFNQKVFSIKQPEKQQEERQFVIQKNFLKHIDTVSYFFIQHINQCKSSKIQDELRFESKIQPIQRNQQYTITIQITIQLKQFPETQIHVNLVYIHQQGLQLMNSAQEISQFKTSFRQKKDELISLLQEDNWSQLYEQADFHTINANMHIQEAQKIMYLPRQEFARNYQKYNIQFTQNTIKNGLIICEYHDEEYIDIMVYLQTIFNKKELYTDIKRILNNPVNITKQEILKHFPWSDFVISPKADGKRTLLIQLNRKCYMLHEKTYIKLQDNVKFDINFVIEAEKVGNMMLCYDIHQYATTNTFSQKYQERITLLSEILKQFDQYQFGQQYRLLQKQYIVIKQNTPKNILKQMFNSINQQDYETDGMIINSNEVYQKQLIFKWKPLDKLSIDLYCYQLNKDDLSQGFNIENIDNIPIGLFTHITKQQFRNNKFDTFIKIPNPSSDETIMLIPFQPSLCPKCFIYWRNQEEEQKEQISGKVCEMLFDQTNNSWKLLRIRTDKDPSKGQLGNYISTAEQTFTDIINYLDISCLYDVSFKNELYFKLQAPQQYKDMTKYINFVKRSLINSMSQQLNNSHKIVALDIGSGKGQDIAKFAAINVKKLICIDKDPNAIQELIQRKLNTKIPNFPIINTHIMDLNDQQQVSNLIDEYKNTKINIITMHLMIHYLISNIESVSQVCQLIEKGGFLSILLMDGQKLFDQLISKDSIELHEQGQIKYQYIKMYKDKQFLNNGQKIQLKLPFSTTLMEEELLNTKYLLKILKQKGMTLVCDFSIDMQGDYGLLNNNDVQQLFADYKNLSENDQNHVKLYRGMLLKKI